MIALHLRPPRFPADATPLLFPHLDYYMEYRNANPSPPAVVRDINLHSFV